MKVFVGMLWLLAVTLAQSAPFQFKEKERVVFIGNAFAERLQWHGYFEATLAAHLPELNLTFRNLGFSGDETLRGTLGTPAGPGTAGKHEENVFLQLRALNFGDIFSHIEQQRADVLIACYGMNESFSGATNLARFETDLADFLTKLLDLKCSVNKSSPRVILVSPIPHEDLGGDLPSPKSHNDDLIAYTAAMRKVASRLGVTFIDLYNPLLPIMADKSGSPLTFNGIHLTAYGNWVAAQIMVKQLLNLTDAVNSISRLPSLPKGALADKSVEQFLPKFQTRLERSGKYRLRVNGRDLGTASSEEWEKGVRVFANDPAADNLLTSINDKNWHFFMLYRAVNGEYIYGRRKEPFGVVSFPPEFKLLEQMVKEKDGAIHTLARTSAKPVIEWIPAE